MPSTTTLTALALLSLGCLATPVALEARQVSPPVALVKSSNYLSVVSVKSSSSPKQIPAAKIKDYGSAKLRDLGNQYDWAAKISFGGEELFVVLDTGISDSWAVQSGFQCINDDGVEVAYSDCNFGPAYNGTFQKGEIPNENFHIQYTDIGTGAANFLTGNLGFSDMTIGGIKVKKQEVALVNQGYFSGDGTTSGLMGLVYRSLTDAYPGTNATADDMILNRIEYSPIVETMIAQGLNPPIFSMALQRPAVSGNNVPGGYIAFGGLPPVSVDPASFVSTPIINFQYDGFPPSSIPTELFTPSGLMDSGTMLLYVPTPIANGYLASFNPPPTVYQGEYFYPCNVTAPEFGIEIAGTTFNISPADILISTPGFTFTNTTTGVEYRLIGVVDGGPEADADPIFGDVFLKNVVAVFNMGTSTMQFTPHIY